MVRQLVGQRRTVGLTVLGGVRRRMTLGASREATPKFCRRARRAMHTWRMWRLRTLELEGQTVRLSGKQTYSQPDKKVVGQTDRQMNRQGQTIWV